MEMYIPDLSTHCKSTQSIAVVICVVKTTSVFCKPYEKLHNADCTTVRKQWRQLCMQVAMPWSTMA